MNGVSKFIRQQSQFPNGVTVFEIDQSKTTFRGALLRDIGTFGRRKFENVLYLKHIAEGRPLKFIYH